MTLDAMLLNELENLVIHDGRRSTTFAHADSAWSVHLTADRCDDMSCSVWELQLRRQTPSDVRETLTTWTQRIAERTTGLLEPLHVWEIDVDRNEGFIRSETPTIRGEKRQYFEIQVSGNTTATVRRYQSQGTAKREQIAFALTHESLAKLAADITSE